MVGLAGKSGLFFCWEFCSSSTWKVWLRGRDALVLDEIPSAVDVRAQARKRSKKGGLGYRPRMICGVLRSTCHCTWERVWKKAVDSEEMGLAVLRQTWLELDCVPSWEGKKRVKTLFLLALCHCQICSATGHRAGSQLDSVPRYQISIIWRLIEPLASLVVVTSVATPLDGPDTTLFIVHSPNPSVGEETGLPSRPQRKRSQRILETNT